jgi:hypothetical protein
VFDGIAQLVQESAPAAPEPSPQLALFDPSRLAAARAEQPGAEPAADPAGPIPELASEAVFLAPKPRRSRAALLAWGLAALVALAALAAQAGLRYRSELSVLAPGLRPHLERVCQAIGCSVRLPHRPELISIESSELQADPRRENVIQLNAVIRNRAPFPQEYPSLELTLIDDNEAAVVRRVLAPRDYLDPRRAPELARGMNGDSEAALRVLFDTSRVRATGYRLYLFYP